MADEKSIPARHRIASAQQNSRNEETADSELIAYYEEKRRTGRSDEWNACLDATIRQLRHC